jgi:cell division protein FtsW (lipid II flippase)
MDTIRDEKRLLRFTYIFCILGFFSLSLLKNPIDKQSYLMGLITCVLIGYSYFVIRRFFPDGDKLIFIFVGILSIVGIITLYGINIFDSIKQIIWFSVGVTVYILIVILLPDLKSFMKYKLIYLILTLLFMSMTLLLGTEINGSKNWIVFHGYMFQPSEFGKIFLCAYLASSLKDYKEDYKDLIIPAIVVMLSLLFMVLQKDLGTALILFGISVTMLYIATSKLRYTLFCFILFSLGSLISYQLFSHIRLRVMIWKNPWLYASDKSLQIVQSMFSIASGGLFGVGLGQGHPEFVPVSKTDFIFPVICEEMGILMGFAIIIIYFLLFYRCMRAAFYVEDKFSRLLAVGLSSMIACQVIVIIGGVTNMIPLTGITMPFISYGGSSMVISFISLGIIQKISEDWSW